MKKVVLLILVVFGIQTMISQTDKEQIIDTLEDYIEGTENGEPERIKQAFHSDLNLYSISNDTLRSLSGKKYIGFFKKGKKANRVGRIVSIDYVNDAAMAKVEIDMPSRKRLYTDYMMLLKIGGEWKIVHKSFTYVTY